MSSGIKHKVFTHTCRGVLYDDAHGNRKFRPHNEQELKWLFLRGNPGDEWILGGGRYLPAHTPEQRGYLHAVVIPEILAALPMDDSKENHDAMYYKIKEKFGPCEMRFGKDGETGEVLAMPKAGRDITVEEMSRMIDGAIQWAGEFLDITITPPRRVLNMGDGGGI